MVLSKIIQICLIIYMRDTFMKAISYICVGHLYEIYYQWCHCERHLLLQSQSNFYIKIVQPCQLECNNNKPKIKVNNNKSKIKITKYLNMSRLTSVYSYFVHLKYIYIYIYIYKESIVVTKAH